MPKSAHLTAALAAAVDAIAQANQVNADDVRNGFAVQPAIAQKMYDEIALNSGLLGKISIVGKTEQVGELVGLSTGLIGSTAKTADPGVERKPTSPAENTPCCKPTSTPPCATKKSTHGLTRHPISPSASTPKLPNPSPSA